MSLINGQQAHCDAAQCLLKGNASQSLRGYIGKPDAALSQSIQTPSLFGRGERTVDVGRRDAEFCQTVHLILHERDERGNHQCQPWKMKRGQLIHQRLPSPGGHHHKGVLAFEQALDSLSLTRSKGLEVEVGVQGTNYPVFLLSRLFRHATSPPTDNKALAVAVLSVPTDTSSEDIEAIRIEFYHATAEQVKRRP